MVREIVDRLVSEGITPFMADQGFKYLKSMDYVRKQGAVQQRLALQFRRRDHESGCLAFFPAVVFDRVEDLAAELSGEPRRKGFPTAAGNIGNLRLPHHYLEFPVSVRTELVSMGALIVQTVQDLAVPFWTDFATLEGLAQGYAANDHRLVRGGSDHRWRHAAACCLTGGFDLARSVVGEHAEALSCIDQWEGGAHDPAGR